MKKQERDGERICNLCKQQVFIRERRPERDPRPSEQHSERVERLPVLQAGVFKHPVVGRGRLEGDGHYRKKMTAKGEWGTVLHTTRKVTGAGQPDIHMVFLWPFIGGSHICFVSEFLNIPAFQAFYYMCACVCV
jgi:hypothetical protein